MATEEGLVQRKSTNICTNTSQSNDKKGDETVSENSNNDDNKQAVPPPNDDNKKAQPPSQSLLRKTVVRSIVGIAMMVFFYSILQLQHKYITVLIVLGQMITWNEVVSLRYKLEKEKQLKLFRTINWYFLIVSFFYFYGKPALLYLRGTEISPIISSVARLTYDFSRPLIFTLYVAGFVAFILSLRGDSLRYQFSQLTWTILTLLMVVGQTHFSMQYMYDGLVWILLPHGLIIVNDIMAYFCGITLGRKIIDRPLFVLSPSKTWEGFIGAMFFTVLFAFKVAPLFLQSDWLICPAGLFDTVTERCDVTSFNHGTVFLPSRYRIPALLTDWGLSSVEYVTLYPLQVHAVFFALFASLVAPFGGFLASSIKRAFNKKDFDSIFPGHGGFMDRVDCQLLMCSFVYIYVTTFVKTEVSPVEALLYQIQQLTKEQQLELFNSPIVRAIQQSIHS